MTYEAYADLEYYKNDYGGNSIPDNELRRELKKASRQVDSLTYNRIVGQGFHNLTEFQQDIVREVVCTQADFVYNNAEVIDSALSGYSINGTSMQFQKGMNIHIQSGIVIKKDTYALLSQTGLCCRLAVR